MKSILISIQPKWCELIANGKKTIEVRKSKSKLQTPFKCYIYCTLPPQSELFTHGSIREYANELIRLQDGRIVYDYGMRLACEEGEYSKDNFLCKKVIGEFVCDRIEKIEPCFEYYSDGYDIDDDMLTETCLTRENLRSYGKGKPLYGWHISYLKIYDTPKELGEFTYPCKKGKTDFNADTHCRGCKYAFKAVTSELIYCDRVVTNPPQSWCYVEEL